MHQAKWNLRPGASSKTGRASSLLSTNKNKTKSPNALLTPLSGSSKNPEKHQLNVLAKSIKQNQGIITRYGSDSSDSEEIDYQPENFADFINRPAQQEIEASQKSFYDDEDSQPKKSLGIPSPDDHVILSETLFDTTKKVRSSTYSSSGDSDQSSPQQTKIKSKKASKIIGDNSLSLSGQLEDDFDKYFGGTQEKLSLSLPMTTKGKKKTTTKKPIGEQSKKRKISEKKIPDEISGIYYSSDDDVAFDNEDSQHGHNIIPSQPIIPSQTQRRKQSLLSQETPSKPSNNRSSRNKANLTPSYSLPKHIQANDDIDEFSDDEPNVLQSTYRDATIPHPALSTMTGPSAALFASPHHQQHLTNHSLVSTYLTQQRQVMNKPNNNVIVDVDDLIVTDSESEGESNKIPNSNVQTTPEKPHTQNTPVNTRKHVGSPPKSTNKDIIVAAEDGFDLEQRLRGIKKKTLHPKESDVEKVLFGNRSTLTEDIVDDETVMDVERTLPTQHDAHSWLDKLRKAKPIQQQPTLSQLSSSDPNSNQYCSQWEHLKKILSTKGSGRFVSKLKRAINGGMNEKVFSSIGSTFNSTQDSGSGIVLKILVVNHNAFYPHLTTTICKIISKPIPHQGENSRIDEILNENEYIDLYLTSEMKEKWNLQPGSIIEISTLFHLTPSAPAELDVNITNSELIYRPRPVLSYFFEVKCKSQSSDQTELINDLKYLQHKYSFSMLSHNRTMDEVEPSTPPSTPPPMPSANLFTPSPVRQRNIIHTPRRRAHTNLDDQMEDDPYERNHHLISRIGFNPLCKPFESVHNFLHSNFFPSYYVNVEATVQRVWSFDYVKHLLEEKYAELSRTISRLFTESDVSNTVLVQCTKTGSLCVILLPAGDSEFHYWKSVFDFDVSQGKVFQFNTCSFKDKVYITQDDELYSIISPMYQSNIDSEPNSQGSNPFIPIFFLTSNSQHTTCKFMVPDSSTFEDPNYEQVASYSNYRHSTYYSFEQPISGDTQQSHGGVEHISMDLDDKECIKLHRCDIEGRILLCRDLIISGDDQSDQTSSHLIYMLQKHSNIILKIRCDYLAMSNMLLEMVKTFEGRTNVMMQNIIVKRYENGSESEIIMDRFGMIYPEKQGNVDEEEFDLSSIQIPYSVKLRNLKKKPKKLADSSMNLDYEYTCAEHSIGIVEGYVTEVIEERPRPSIPTCPHCSEALEDVEPISGSTICRKCFSKFEKPEYDLRFRVCVGPSTILTLDTKAIQHMFSHKKASKSKKLPVTGNETFKQARDLVVHHYLKFLCYCNRAETIQTSERRYQFEIVNGFRLE